MLILMGITRRSSTCATLRPSQDCSATRVFRHAWMEVGLRSAVFVLLVHIWYSLQSHVLKIGKDRRHLACCTLWLCDQLSRKLYTALHRSTSPLRQGAWRSLVTLWRMGGTTTRSLSKSKAEAEAEELFKAQGKCTTSCFWTTSSTWSIVPTLNLSACYWQVTRFRRGTGGE